MGAKAAYRDEVAPGSAHRYDRCGGRQEQALRSPIHASFAAVTIFLITVLLAACGDDDNRPPATPGVPTPPPDAAAIRQLDLNQVPAVQMMLSQVGSSSAIAQGAVIYADLSGDGREEAVVPIASGGTLGNLAYVVLMLKSGQPQEVLTRTVGRSAVGGLNMELANGVLIETSAEYGPSDALCCPSALHVTSFRWDGSRLQVAGEERIALTPGPKQQP